MIPTGIINYHVEKQGIDKFFSWENFFDIRLSETCENDSIISEDFSDKDMSWKFNLKNGDIKDTSSDLDKEIEQVESNLPTMTNAKGAIQVLNNFSCTQNIKPRVLGAFCSFSKGMDSFS